MAEGGGPEAGDPRDVPDAAPSSALDDPPRSDAASHRPADDPRSDQPSHRPADDPPSDGSRHRPLAEPELAAAEGASPLMVRVVRGMTARWPTVGRFAAFAVAVYGRYARHRGAVLAGGLAFFGMLSLVPSMLTLGALVALLVDPVVFVENLRRALSEHPEAAGALAPVVDELTRIATSTTTSIGVAGLVGLGFSLYAASRFVYVGRQVLDIAFELEPRPPSLITRGVSVLITVVFQVVLLLGLSVLSVIPRLLDRFGLGAAYTTHSSVVRMLIALPVMYLLLTAGMRFGTSLRTVGWLNLGGAIGALLIVGGTWGLGWYLGASVTYSQIIAVLGGVIALELWLYLVGLAVVLSAEIEALRLGRWHVRRSPPVRPPIRLGDERGGS